MTKTRKLTECGIAVAMAAVLSFVTVWKMPQGGSVSLVMVPLFIAAYRHGALWGTACGAVYGLLALMLDGVVYHPLSVLLDYVLAFGLLGIAGLFGKGLRGIVLGTVSGTAGRFASSVLSGWLLFAEYAPEGQNPLVYSLVYQATYLVPEMILSILALLLLYKKAKRLFAVKCN